MQSFFILFLISYRVVTLLAPTSIEQVACTDGHVRTCRTVSRERFSVLQVSIWHLLRSQCRSMSPHTLRNPSVFFTRMLC